MLKYLVLASIFWFNPLISNVDILPDFFGYLLLIKAFSKASYVSEYADDVCVSAKKMCIITGVKILSIFMVSSFDPTMSLLLSFTFGIVECIFGLPVFFKLFYALLHLTPASNIRAQAKESFVKKLTVFAFVSRHVFAILPDLSALTLNDAFTLEADYSFMRFKPLLVAFAFIISLVICIVWLAKFISYLKCTVTKELDVSLSNEFREKIKKRQSIFETRDNIRVTVMVSVASVFVFDFNWAYTNADIFQDFMLPTFAVLGFLYLVIKKAYKVNVLFLALIGVLGLQALANIFEIKSNVKYFGKYNLASVLKVSEAESWYFNVILTAVFSAIMLVASCVLVWTVMRQNAKLNIIKHKALFSESDIDYYLREYDIRTKKKTTLIIVFSIISAIVSVLTVMFKMYADWLILLNYVTEILLIIVLINATLYIHDEVYKRILYFS